MNKFGVLRHLLKANGITWLFLVLLERATKNITSYFYRKRVKYEAGLQLPGFNSIEYNHKEWNQYDWSNGGEEWTPSPEWKQSLVTFVLEAHMPKDAVVLEVGPGAGRWSEALARSSAELILVDLTQASIDECKKKLSGFSNCTYFKNNGDDLSFIADAHIDFLWSFDVFVHIAPRDVERYVREFQRVFKKGGVGIIHHSTRGTSAKGFRSSLTNDQFLSFLDRHEFEVLTQMKSWGPDLKFGLTDGDIITVFRKS